MQLSSECFRKQIWARRGMLLAFLVSVVDTGKNPSQFFFPFPSLFGVTVLFRWWNMKYLRQKYISQFISLMTWPLTYWFLLIHCYKAASSFCLLYHHQNLNGKVRVVISGKASLLLVWPRGLHFIKIWSSYNQRATGRQRDWRIKQIEIYTEWL